LPPNGSEKGYQSIRWAPIESAVLSDALWMRCGQVGSGRIQKVPPLHVFCDFLNVASGLNDHFAGL
jgi:hypothetical protein